jgi:IS5 family transposase
LQGFGSFDRGTLQNQFWDSVESRDVNSVAASEDTKRPKQRQTTGSGDLFRARLDQIINMKHELVQLAGKLAQGRPGIETRLMIGLLLLKHTEIGRTNLNSGLRPPIKPWRSGAKPNLSMGRPRIEF